MLKPAFCTLLLVTSKKNSLQFILPGNGASGASLLWESAYEMRMEVSKGSCIHRALLPFEPKER